MAVIEHGNPYTHAEATRESTAGNGRTCDWCGQAKRVLFNFNRQRRTGGGLAWVCNKGCSQSYAG